MLPDALEQTITNALINEINDEDYDVEACIIHHKKNVDLIATNIELSDMENTMVHEDVTIKEVNELLKGKNFFFITISWGSLVFY